LKFRGKVGGEVRSGAPFSGFLGEGKAE